jgi:radical SAM protein with 4Fe4S-binding SPASM domain
MPNKLANFTPPFSSDRKPLHTLLPAAAPIAVYIDPSDYCNFKCNFCFQHDGIKNQCLMDIKFLNKLADDLIEFEEPVKKIHLHAFGEPLLNPEFVNFIKILKSKLSNTTKLCTTTNAVRLSKKMAEEVIDAGLDNIIISIYGLNDEQYLKNCNTKVDFNQIKENCIYLFSIKKNLQIHIKSMADFFSKEEQQEFVEYFGQYCDTIYLDNMTNIWPGIKVTEKRVNQYNTQNERSICPMPFYQMVIHSNGQVSPCCAEYAQGLVMGDATKNKLVDIWNGSIWHNLRLNILEDHKIGGVCASCEYPDVGASVDITPYREELLHKYKELNYGRN